MRIPTLISIATLIAATPALAETPSGLTRLVETKEATGAVARAEYADFDGDGLDEALLSMSDPCEDGACRWELLDTGPDGAAGVASAGMAERLELVRTEPSGAAIDADGVIFAWSGSELYPYHDLLPRLDPVRTGMAGMNAIEDITGMRYQGAGIDTYELDLVGDAADERVHVLTGDPANGMFRFLITDPDDGLLLDGWSMDRPRLFVGADPDIKTTQVVAVTKGGMIVSTLE